MQYIFRHSRENNFASVSSSRGGATIIAGLHTEVKAEAIQTAELEDRKLEVFTPFVAPTALITSGARDYARRSAGTYAGRTIESGVHLYNAQFAENNSAR